MAKLPSERGIKDFTQKKTLEIVRLAQASLLMLNITYKKVSDNSLTTRTVEPYEARRERQADGGRKAFL